MRAMTLRATLRLKGIKQGEIKGSANQPGLTGVILVLGFEHGLQSPRDPGSGLPTGRRQHQQVLIQKEVDRSTPQLLQALVTNEVMQEWELCFWQSMTAERLQEVYSVRLFGAQILSSSSVLQEGRLLERVSFGYRTIQWTYTSGNIVAMDDWQAPVA